MLLSDSERLHHTNTNFHLNEEVETVAAYMRASGEHVANNPAAKLVAYFGLLSDPEYVNDGLLTRDHDSICRQICHIVFGETFNGEVDTVTELEQTQLYSLSAWFNTLTDESNAFPDWFRFYVLKNVRRSSVLNVYHTAFTARGNVADRSPFPEPNVDALQRLLADMTSKVPAKNQQKFGKAYAKAHGEHTAAQRETLTGTWRTYPSCSDSTALIDDIFGHNTEWCIARFAHANEYLKDSDISIFYTNDKLGQPTIPRLAIVSDKEDNVITEVRGILAGQNIEAELIPTLREAFLNFWNGTDISTVLDDEKAFHDISTKLSVDPNATLSLDELIFLSGYDHEPLSFENEGIVNQDLLRRSVIRKLLDSAGLKDEQYKTATVAALLEAQLSNAYDMFVATYDNESIYVPDYADFCETYAAYYARIPDYTKTMMFDLTSNGGGDLIVLLEPVSNPVRPSSDFDDNSFREVWGMPLTNSIQIKILIPKHKK